MSLQQQQNFLARLYTDAEFRREFLSSPEKIGAENDLNGKEISEIAEIMPEELIFFAESLFGKRLREVERLLPLTKKALGDDFTKLFRAFSQGFNPQSVKKHLEDALEFSKFLYKNKQIEMLWAKDLAKFEHSRLIFNSASKKIRCAVFEHDLRQIIREISTPNSSMNTDFRRKKTIAVWLKFGKRTKYFIW